MDLPFHHRDPFDRILVAQCLAEKMTLLTGDPQLHKYSAIKTLW
jgi:PIN domain nuclease of toxin-antitoxin system